MTKQKQKKLEAAGWRVGDAADFLALTPQEDQLVTIRVRLSRALRQRRRDLKWNQTTLARKIGTSQARIARAEGARAGISIDFFIQALVATGADGRMIGRIVAGED